MLDNAEDFTHRLEYPFFLKKKLVHYESPEVIQNDLCTLTVPFAAYCELREI